VGDDSTLEAAQHPRLYEALGGHELDDWEAVVALDRRYFDAAERLFRYPDEHRALSEKDRALIELAFDALVTQLDETRLEEDIRRAAESGATQDEVVCVLETIAVAGMHSCSVGIPVLAEELHRKDGQPSLTPRQTEVARRFETSGPRPRPLDGMYASILELDAEYFERFVQFIDVPWREDVLDPRLKHLVCIAIDVACSHLYVEGIHRHVREALELGVTADEILEVIQLASATGLRTLKAALPVVLTVFGGSDVGSGR
jgi:alkylhydroperoxidase/carboxymuconolactone decarboxylase family protein YurZ